MVPIYTPESPDNKAIRELRNSVKDLNKSTRFSSRVMIVLTIILVTMTGALIWFAKIQVAPILDEQTRINQQWLENCKVLPPEYEVPMANGAKMKCPEFVEKLGE